MKPCLVDVNVWLALLVPRHAHHGSASQWYEELRPSQAVLCRFVQLAVVRLLANPAVMGDDATPALTGFKLTQELIADERVEQVKEPDGIDAILPDLFNHPAPAPKIVSDAYLAAFAIAGNMRLVTFDRGFKRFPALDVTLLSLK